MTPPPRLRVRSGLALATLLAAGLVPGVAVTAFAASGGSAPSKASCASVAKSFPNGLAKSAANARAWQAAGGVRPRVDAKKFASVKALDRDRDGVVCGRIAPVELSNVPVLAAGDTANLRPIEDCKLTTPNRYGVSLALNRPEGRARTTDKVQTTFVFVDFPNAPASQSVQDRYASMGPGAISLLGDSSYGRLSIVPNVVPTWVRMPKPTDAYAFVRGLTFDSHKAYIADAVAAAGSAIDPSKADLLVVVAPLDAPGLGVSPAFTANPGDGVVVGGRVVDNAVTVNTDFPNRQDRVLAHELLHTLGLVDLYAFDSSQALFGYTGPYSVMGDITTPQPGPLAWERWVLRWIPDRQMACLDAGTSTVTLESVSRPGTGVKSLVVPRPDGTAVVVESRTPEGADAGGGSGLVVYVVDPRIPTGQGPVRVVRNPDGTWSQLAAGSAVSIGGVTVKVLDGGRVQVTS